MKKEKNNREKIISPTLKLLFQAARVAPFKLLLYIFIVVIAGFIPAVQLQFTKIFTDNLAEYWQSASNIKWHTIFLPFILIQLGIWVLGSIVDSIEQNVQEVVCKQISYIIRERIVKTSSLISVEIFESPEFFDSYSVANEKANDINSFFVFVVSTFQQLIIVLSVGAMLFRLNPVFVLILAVFAILKYIIENKYFVSNWSNVIRETPERRIFNYYESVLSSRECAKEVRIFGSFDFFMKKCDKYHQELFDKHMNRTFKTSKMQYIVSVFNNIVNILFCIYIINGVSGGTNTVGDVLISFGAVSNVQYSMGRMITLFIYTKMFFMGTGIVAKFMNRVENIKPEMSSIKYARDINYNERGIRLENVSFTYPGSETEVLSDISLFIPENKTVAFAGQNGAGKTTLVKLIMGLYKPTSGQIYLNGRAIESYSEEERTKYYTAIFQDFICYNLSLAENIAFEKKNDTEGVNRAAQQAGLNDVINKMDNDVNAMLGTMFGGIDLSGGQWQRVALARAFYKNTPIVIMDEPTAALDPRAEYELIHSYSDIMKDKTGIIVSHRFANIKDADYIYVIADKKISEKGTHSELIEKGGEYKTLFEIQSNNFLEERSTAL